MQKLFTHMIAGMAGGVLVLAVLLCIPIHPPGSAHLTPALQTKLVKNQVVASPALPDNFTAAAEKTMPSVVHIAASEQRRRQNDQIRDPFQFFFEDDLFFNFPFEMPPQQGSGSGVIISKDGYIVTNNHVVEFADQVEVTLYDDRTFQADIVGVDPRTDLAVIKIEAQDLIPIEFGNSEKARVGEWVLAVGNPFDLTSTVTAGIISAKGRDIDVIRRSDAIENFIQTDAAVNPGNSGGALVNIEGQLLGINTAIATPTGAFAGYSFAIPADMVENIVYNIIELGGPRGSMGIIIVDLDEELIETFQPPGPNGVLVEEVEDGSAGQFAGIIPNDIILRLNELPIKDAASIIELMNDKKVGEIVNVTLWRRMKEETVRVKLRKE